MNVNGLPLGTRRGNGSFCWPSTLDDLIGRGLCRPRSYASSLQPHGTCQKPYSQCKNPLAAAGIRLHDKHVYDMHV